MERFDVLVLGGSGGGRVLASQLSENRDRTVCIVEAGPDYGPADRASAGCAGLGGFSALRSHDGDRVEAGATALHR
jgi:choline dehydrogenase